MRRAPIVISATLVGTAGVLLFKPLPASSVESSSASESTSSTGTSSSGDATSAAGASSTSSATGTSSPTATAGSTAKASTAASTTVTGALETDRYGNTQVKVTIKNGTITAVTVLAYNDDDPRSAQISESAIPTLREEVLSKQTAAVDAVSGATYTSNAYEASLQSALDKAGFKASDGSTASTDIATADENLGGH